MEAETEKSISTEFGEENDNKLFQWVRPLHL